MSGQTEDPLVLLGSRIPLSLRWRMRELASQRRRTLEQEIREALERHLEAARREQQARA
jgi:predicted DNA-binding protein